MDNDDDDNIIANVIPVILQAVALISEDLVGDVGQQQLRQYAATLREFQQLTANPAGHHSRPRSKRRKFDHARSLYCIMRDYMGPEPLFGE